MKTKKHKILYTSHTANFQKFNQPFMKLMKDNGWEVHYASMGEEGVKNANKVFVVPFSRNPFSLSNIKAYRQLKKIIDSEKYDIIHTHTPVGSVVTRLAARDARKNGTKVIYTAHGFHFFKGAPIINWLLWYPAEKIMAHFTDTLITINKEDYNRAKKRLKTQVEYVPGVGVDVEKFRPKLTHKERVKLRSELGLKAEDFVMIYPAELSRRKNQKMIIKLMRDLLSTNKYYHLLLPGKDSMNGYHRRLAERLGVLDNVHFLGYRNDIPELMEIANLAVSTSYQEGLPLNIMEAMAAGLAVVAVECRGVSELLENTKGCLVGRRYTCLKEGVSRLAMDGVLLNNTAQVNYSSVLSYDLTNIYPLMRHIYLRK